MVPVSYQGAIDGDYPQAEEYTDACLEVKDCMGLEEEDYLLPRIRIYEADTIDCSGGNPPGCYRRNIGRIDIAESAPFWVIFHECVHHWLKKDTGNSQAGHCSDFFFLCGESTPPCIE